MYAGGKIVCGFDTEIIAYINEHEIAIIDELRKWKLLLVTLLL